MATTDIDKANGIELPVNAEYSESYDEWLLFRDVYESKPDIMRDPGYLIRHDLETKKDGGKKFILRQSRTFPLNFTNPIVSIWQDLFMKGEPVVPESVNKLFNGREDDVDGNGNNLISYLETEMLRDRFLYGQPTTMVDAPFNTALNATDERVKGIRPYLVPINRLALVDWSIEKSATERSGRYNFVTYQYLAHVPRQDYKTKDAMMWFRRVLYRENDKVFSQIYMSDTAGAKEWKPQGGPQELTGFTEIPVVTMFGAETWIHDVAYQCLKYMNLESTLDNILYYQGYRHTFVTGDIPPSERGKINEWSMVILPSGSSVTSLTAENPAALLQRLAETENNIWRFGLQQIRQIPTNSKVGQSADSKREEREPTLNMVKRNIRQFELFANQIVKQVAAYHKQDSEPEKITFSRDISDTDINQTVLVFQTLQRDMSRLPTFKREVVRQLVQSLNFRQEVQSKIDAEIDDMPDEDMETPEKAQQTLMQVFNSAQKAEVIAAKNGSPVNGKAGLNGGPNQSPN